MTISNQQFEEMRARTMAAIRKLKPEDAAPSVIPMILIYIFGQIRGGKNNMIVTRNGLHFPKPEWAKWRDEAVTQVRKQLPAFKQFTEPVNMRLDYFAGDRRRRDMPAILDSIFHVLEKAGVVSDDSLIWVTESSRGYDKKNPRCAMQITLKEAA